VLRMRGAPANGPSIDVYWVVTHLKNLEKSRNLTLVREKSRNSGKVKDTGVLPQCDSHRIIIT